MADRNHLATVALLMKQSENASTDEEGAVYAERAQALSTKYSISEAMARAYTDALERRATPVQKSIRIGERGKRGLADYIKLLIAVLDANDVKCDIMNDNTAVYCFGFQTDIDAAEMIFGHLLVQMVRASNAYLASGEYKGDTRNKPIYSKGRVIAHRWNGKPIRRRVLEGYETVPVAPATARKSFQQAFADSIGARLATARRETIQRAKDDEAAYAATSDAPLSTSTELVLKAKEVEVRDFYRQHSDARGSWRGGRREAAQAVNSAAAGFKAGREISLGIHREIA